MTVVEFMCRELRECRYHAGALLDEFKLPNGETLILEYLWFYRHPDVYRYGLGSQGLTGREARALKRARKQGLAAKLTENEIKGQEDLKKLEDMLREVGDE